MRSGGLWYNSFYGSTSSCLRCTQSTLLSLEHSLWDCTALPSNKFCAFVETVVNGTDTMPGHWALSTPISYVTLGAPPWAKILRASHKYWAYPITIRVQELLHVMFNLFDICREVRIKIQHTHKNPEYALIPDLTQNVTHGGAPTILSARRLFRTYSVTSKAIP